MAHRAVDERRQDAWPRVARARWRYYQVTSQSRWSGRAWRIEWNVLTLRLQLPGGWRVQVVFLMRGRA